MGEKLQQSDRFPSISLRFVDGGTLKLPDEMDGRYLVLIFYRGHW